MQQSPAKSPSLQQLVNPPFHKPANPSPSYILTKFFRIPPLQRSLPPYQYLVYITERGFAASELKILADKELRKVPSLPLRISLSNLLHVVSQSRRKEKQIDELKPVLMTFGTSPLQKALAPSFLRQLMEILMFVIKFLESCRSLGGTSMTILMFQMGCRVKAVMQPDMQPQSPCFSIVLQTKFNFMNSKNYKLKSSSCVRVSSIWAVLSMEQIINLLCNITVIDNSAIRNECSLILNQFRFQVAYGVSQQVMIFDGSCNYGGRFVINMKTNQYKIVDNIGKGQYGNVYLATNHQLQYFALKNTQKNKEQQHEATLLAHISHPNIIQFIECFEEEQQLTIVMEHAAHGDLSHFIKQHYPNEYIPQSTVRSWILQLTLALHYLHQEMHIIHRDIKLINVLVSKSEVLKLCDFGLAQQIVLKGQQKQSTVGTPYYLSPESVMFGKFSIKSDIWGLGCLIYEICTGQKPFTGKSMGQILKSITNGYFNELPEQAQYSKWLTSLIQTMLQKDPQKRPSTKTMLEDEQMRKQFIILKKKYEEYKNVDYPHVQVRTKKHVIVEEKLGQNFRFAHAMLKTAKRQKSIKLPDVLDSKFEKQDTKKVQRVKFANKSLQFLLQKKQRKSQSKQQ